MLNTIFLEIGNYFCRNVYLKIGSFFQCVLKIICIGNLVNSHALFFPTKLLRLLYFNTILKKDSVPFPSFNCRWCVFVCTFIQIVGLIFEFLCWKNSRDSINQLWMVPKQRYCSNFKHLIVTLCKSFSFFHLCLII